VSNQAKETHKSAPINSALQHFDSLPDSANVRLPVVQALFACSSSSVWRGVKRKTIPKPHKLSERVTAWNVGQLREALKNAQGGTPDAS